MALLDTLIGGFLDKSAAESTNEANLAANRANIASTTANQEKALGSLTGTSPFSTTTRNAEGGFDTTSLGAPSAAQARSDLAFGDVGRAANINEATGNFNFKLPTLESAQGIVNRDRALQDEAIIQPGINALTKANVRQFGGLGNTNQGGSLIDALSKFSAQNRIGGERAALDLFNKSGQSDQALLAQLIANNMSLAPAPSFAENRPGTTAANVIAQTPTAATVADLGGAILPSVGSNIVSQYQDTQQRADTQQNLLEVIRSLGTQGAF